MKACAHVAVGLLLLQCVVAQAPPGTGELCANNKPYGFINVHVGNVQLDGPPVTLNLKNRGMARVQQRSALHTLWPGRSLSRSAL